MIVLQQFIIDIINLPSIPSESLLLLEQQEEQRLVTAAKEVENIAKHMHIMSVRRNSNTTSSTTNRTLVNIYIISMKHRNERLKSITKRLDSILISEKFVLRLIHYQGINGTEVILYQSSDSPKPYNDWVHYKCPFKTYYQSHPNEKVDPEQLSNNCQYYERNVTAGEIGCSISHMNIIKYIYYTQYFRRPYQHTQIRHPRQPQQDTNTDGAWNIIVEDDVHFDTHMLHKIQSVYDHEIPTSTTSMSLPPQQQPNWDILYLARQQILNDTTKEYSKNLVVPGRSWGGWAIMYSKVGITKLVTQYFPNFEKI